VTLSGGKARQSEDLERRLTAARAANLRLQGIHPWEQWFRKTPSSAAVQAHVQSLNEDVRHLLEVLVVAGRPLSAKFAVDAARATHEQLNALHAERVVRRSGSGQELNFECYHDKIRESVGQALSVERVRALHAGLFAAKLGEALAHAGRGEGGGLSHSR
jgi:hypothetical protein